MRKWSFTFKICICQIENQVKHITKSASDLFSAERMRDICARCCTIAGIFQFELIANQMIYIHGATLISFSFVPWKNTWRYLALNIYMRSHNKPHLVKVQEIQPWESCFFFGFVSLSFCCIITLLYFSICLTTETEIKNVEYFVLWLLFGFQSATTPLQTNDICLDSNRWASRISGFCCFVFGSVIVVLSKWLIIYTNICQAFIEICLVWNISGV